MYVQAFPDLAATDLWRRHRQAVDAVRRVDPPQLVLGPPPDFRDLLAGWNRAEARRLLARPWVWFLFAFRPDRRARRLANVPVAEQVR